MSLFVMYSLVYKCINASLNLICFKSAFIPKRALYIIYVFILPADQAKQAHKSSLLIRKGRLRRECNVLSLFFAPATIDSNRHTREINYNAKPS